jgi:NitT/TauT family transport system substrate-binding protein
MLKRFTWQRERRVVPVGAAALAVAGLAACSTAASSGSTAGNLTTINFAGPPDPNGQYAQVAYGVQEGIFRKYGINFHIEYPTTNGSPINQLVVNGTYQLTGADPLQLIAEYSSGVKLKAIASFVESTPYGLTLRKSDGITSAKQLVGKAVGVPAGSTAGAVLDAYLKNEGMNPSSVKQVDLSLSVMPAALVSGKIDAILAYPSGQDPKVNALGVQTNDLLFKDAGISCIAYVWAVGAAWAHQHPTVVQNLVKAIQASTSAAQKNPEAAAKALIATAPSIAPSLSVVLQSMKAEKPFLDSPNTVGKPVGYMSPKDWAETLQFGIKYDDLKPMNVSLVYTDEYVH